MGFCRVSSADSETVVGFDTRLFVGGVTVSFPSTCLMVVSESVDQKCISNRPRWPGKTWFPLRILCSFRWWNNRDHISFRFFRTGQIPSISEMPVFRSSVELGYRREGDVNQWDLFYRRYILSWRFNSTSYIQIKECLWPLSSVCTGRVVPSPYRSLTRRWLSFKLSSYNSEDYLVRGILFHFKWEHIPF